MTSEQREEFWRRFREEIEVLRATGESCHIDINPFEIRTWNVKFTKHRAADQASVSLTIAEVQTSNLEFLLAVSPTYTRNGNVREGGRLVVPVLFDSVSECFLLHADHGPVRESQMADFFVRMTDMLLTRL